MALSSRASLTIFLLETLATIALFLSARAASQYQKLGSDLKDDHDSRHLPSNFGKSYSSLYPRHSPVHSTPSAHHDHYHYSSRNYQERRSYYESGRLGGDSPIGKALLHVLFVLHVELHVLLDRQKESYFPFIPHITGT